MGTHHRLAGIAAVACLAVTGLGGCGAASRPASSLFAARCGSCHTLTGRTTPSHQGGDLLGLRISAVAMRQFVAEMPVHPPLTARQVRVLTRYVLDVERRSAARDERPDAVQHRS